AREPETEEPGEEAADRERRGEPGDQRQPLVTDDVLRLGYDDRAERGAVPLEAERLRDGEVGPRPPRRPKPEAVGAVRGERGRRDRRLREPLEPGALPGERGRADVEQLVTRRELESGGREVGRGRPFVRRAQCGVAVQARDAPRLAAELLVGLVAREAGEELDGDERRDEAGEHDPEQE